MKSRARKFCCRSQLGTNIVEFGGALMIGLPLIMAMLYGIVECSMLFAIRTNLDNATRLAAQLLINDYESSGSVSNGTATNLPGTYAFDIAAGIPGYYFVHKSAKQFTWTWSVNSSPKTVTVRVAYPTTQFGVNGLLPFPHPDPFHLGSNFQIATTGTFSAP
ncbi:MAG TPA: TadE family protein [Candidatus Obscuribacterales bacterium]